MSAAHDACPKCGGPKRTKNRQCAACRGYGRKRHLMPSGYVRVYVPGHPAAASDGYALEHRYVLHEAAVALPDGHHVHHVNGDKADNRIENLSVLTPADHGLAHARRRDCETCGTTFRPWKAAGRFCSRACANKRAVGVRIHRRDHLTGGFFDGPRP